MAPQQGSNPMAPHTVDRIKGDRHDVPRDVPPRDEYNPSDGRLGSRDTEDESEEDSADDKSEL
ncbi:hypothetical protein [Bordetella genomosp. 11]|uniref:Uncharacterized protein n=1 Tax=Bordetella genomosp. 11 TaxID=1416808 RepID=A0A261UZR6_9BORD|nr:hypothetical protein [Bordetella genomosp. 11]OZI66842.1 hypothetical protein CAL28_03730 [Bordetella genomosp. 11]